MKNFLNVVRQTLRYRFTILASFACSLIVGMLWGANIGTLYPFIETVFHGESIAESIDRRVVQSEEKITAVKEKLLEIDRQLVGASAADQLEFQHQQKNELTRLQAEQKSLDRMLSWKPFVEKHMPATPFQTLLMVVSILLTGTLLKCLFLAWNEILVHRLVQRTIFDLRKQFYRATLKMDLANFEEDRTSKLMARFTHDITRIGEGLGMLFGQAIREPLKMLCCLIGAACISWRLLILSILVAPLGLLIIRGLSKALKQTSHLSMSAMSELYARLAESFNGIMIVKAFTMERYERRRFHEASKTIYRRVNNMAMLRSYLKPVGELTGVAVMSLGLIAGAHLVLNKETAIFGIQVSNRPLTPTALLVFYGFLVGFTDPVRKLAGISVTLHRTIAASDRLYLMMSRVPKVKDPVHPLDVPRPLGDLVFENVEFHYGHGPAVLQDINLRIAPGECVALVGSNGCGKSTLIKMIPRFIDPIQGSVSFGDTKLRDLRVRDIRNLIGVVTQTTRLFDDTVMNNIRYGASHATEKQVIEAARRGGAHDFIVDKLSDGYDTIIGEGGGCLSGGQAQRISLARAILRDPQILVLDEATSNIDIKSELEIRQTLAEFIQGRTTVLVTHRASMLQLADRIVVMHAGTIRDTGTHDELLVRCASYRHMHRQHWKKSA